MTSAGNLDLITPPLAANTKHELWPSFLFANWEIALLLMHY